MFYLQYGLSTSRYVLTILDEILTRGKPVALTGNCKLRREFHELWHFARNFNVSCDIIIYVINFDLFICMVLKIIAELTEYILCYFI